VEEGLRLIAVAIAFVDQEAVTRRCLERLGEMTEGELELILVDNGSTVPYPGPLDFARVHHLRNETNLGFLTGLRQALDVVESPLLVHTHNDVLIHEKGWDRRLQEAFAADPALGLAGFFGAPGLDRHGHRIGPHSNMLGQEWGVPYHVHGGHLAGQHPACVFDGLAMIWRVQCLRQIGIPLEYPPYYWFDVLITLRAIAAGWRAATIGIAFDHAGGTTSLSPAGRDLPLTWCVEHGVAPEPTPDGALFNYGRSLFDRDYGWRMPLGVDLDYQYTWTRS
jgi:GT2 family glycosyltransferase